MVKKLTRASSTLYLYCVIFQCWSLPCILFEAYLQHTEYFRKKLDGSVESSLFIGNNRHHILLCGKMISSWVKKVLIIAEAHTFPGTLHGVAASADLVAWVSLVSIQEPGDFPRVSIQGQLVSKIYHYHRLAPGFSTAWCPGP